MCRALSVQVVSLLSNPYGGTVESGNVVSFSVRCRATSVSLVDLDPPLLLSIRGEESEDASMFRRCVFWNHSVANWSDWGMFTTRANLTHTACSSSHATSFAVELQRVACPFCRKVMMSGLSLSLCCMAVHVYCHRR